MKRREWEDIYTINIFINLTLSYEKNSGEMHLQKKFNSYNLIRTCPCPTVYISNVPVPQTTCKYLGMTLDRRLTWSQHIKIKRQPIKLRTKYLFSHIGNRSSLPLSKEFSIYKYLLMPIWMSHIWLSKQNKHSIPSSSRSVQNITNHHQQSVVCS